MKQTIMLTILCLPFLLHAQFDTSVGIIWAEGHSWEQIKQKAKKENKYIFMDTYTTWCGPCKKMDKEVYTDENVAKVVNEKFISVKVQMDTSKNDKQEIRNWYADAHLINKTYNIVGYPTFLFFSPKGELVHNNFGFKNAAEFISLVELAIDPKKQYYKLIEKYKNGKLPYSEMPSLAQNAMDLKEKDLAKQIAENYLTNYLYKQKDEVLFMKENLSFMSSFIQRSNERGFQIFLKDSKRIDEIMGNNYSQKLIDYIITKENISPLLIKADSLKAEPQWTLIGGNICKLYNNEYAFRNVLDAQIRWFTYKKNWARLADAYVDKFQKFGIDTTGFQKFAVNNLVWDVFFIHSTNYEYLTKAIGWMETVLNSDPYAGNIIDTYANLLHKVGRTKEAIKFETIATRLDPGNKQLVDALEKMKKGEPTHLEDGAKWVLGTSQGKDCKTN